MERQTIVPIHRSQKCDICTNLKATPYGTGTWTGTWLSIMALVRSRQRGCAYCASLLDIARSFGFNHGEVFWLELRAGLGGLGMLTQWGSKPLMIKFHPEVKESSAHSRIGVATPSINPDSEATFTFIKDRLKRCVALHSECSPNTLSPLPLRVLDISGGVDSIRLVEKKAATGTFAALSYCWGDQSKVCNLMLQTNTKSGMQGIIPWQSLLKVFQDAITIATKLQIPFLWIDSLCILQDSKEDWERESAKMADYYSNAFVTISADAISNPNQSLFAPRAACWKPMTLLPSSKCASRGKTMQARRICGTFSAPHASHQYIPTTPLGARGWTWQEHILSCRVIHYIESEVVWECRKSTFSEDRTKIESPLYSQCQSLHQFTKSPYRTWRDWVEIYSARLFTFETDRLPAISGVAKLLSEQTGSQYLAGLWRNSILHDLLWAKRDRDMKTGVQFSTGIPSWSWASLNVPVRYPTNIDIKNPFQSTVLEADCIVSGLNPFGGVTGGFIKIRGPLFYGNLLQRAENYFLEYKDYTKMKIEMDCTPEPSTSSHFPDETSVGRSKKAPSVELPCSLPVHILALCQIDDNLCRALVLGRSTTVMNAYTRLGTVDIKMYKFGISQYQWDYQSGAYSETVVIV